MSNVTLKFCLNMLLLSSMLLLFVSPSVNGQTNLNTIAVVYENDTERICVTNSSYAMIWNYEILDKSPEWQVSKYALSEEPRENGVDCPLGYHDTCTYTWKTSEWQPSDSVKDGISELIFDRRWEEFVTHQTTYNTEYEYLSFSPVVEIPDGLNFTIPVSIRKHKQAHILLCNGKKPPTSDCYWIILDGWGTYNLGIKSVLRKCRKYGIGSKAKPFPEAPCSTALSQYDSKVLNEDRWIHFVIEKRGPNLKVIQKTLHSAQIILEYSDNDRSPNNVDKDHVDVRHVIIHGKEDTGLWKFHQLEYMKTTQEHNLIGIGQSFEPVDNNVCISIFIKLCMWCVITIKVADIDNFVIYDQTFSGTQSFGWQQKTILAQNVEKKKYQLYVRSEKNSQDDTYWMIDSPKLCAITEFRTHSMPSSQSGSCEVLEYDYTVPNDKSSKEDIHDDNNCDFDTFSSYCLHCGLLNNKIPLCSSAKVWKFDETKGNKYACTAGYTGKKCKEECKNTYGFECRYQCGQCTDNRCNNIDGFCEGESCREGFSGYKCDIAPGFIWNAPPKIISSGYTFCNIEFEKDAGHYGFVNEDPLYYIFQVKESAVSSWDTSTTSDEFSIEYIQPVSIANLKSHTTYDIRVIVYGSSKKGYTGHLLPSAQCNTTCKAISQEDITVDTTDATAKFRIKEDNELCPSSDYSFRIKNKTIRKARLSDIHYEVLGLQPFTEYNLIVIGNGTEFMKGFKTQEGAPGIVTNLTYESDTHRIILNWGRPELVNGYIRKYMVRYKLVRKQACKNNHESQVKSVDVTETTLILNDLKPYAIYLVEIAAVTVIEGEVHEQEIMTKEIEDYISEDEVPNVENVTASSRNVIINFSPKNCENINGRVIANVKTSSSKNWCKNLIFHETLKPKCPSLTRSGLWPYCDYKLTTSFCRQESEQICTRTNELEFSTSADVPGDIAELDVYSKDDSSISLRWKQPYPPTGELESYRVGYKCSNCYLYNNWKYININITECIIWSQLHCYTLTSSDFGSNEKYEIRIYAKNKVGLQGSGSPTVYTIAKVEAPEPPYNLTLSWIGEKLNISWVHPNRTNGQLRQFEITIQHNKQATFEFYYLQSVKDFKLVYHHQVQTAIDPSTEYQIYVFSRNTKFAGIPVAKNDTSPPPEPCLEKDPFTSDSANTTITVTIPALKQNLRKFEFKNYVCILVNSTRTNINADSNKYLEEILYNKLLECKRYRIVYCGKTAPYKQFSFVIGGNQTHTTNSSYENYPLEHGEYYTIKVMSLNKYKNKCRHKFFDLQAVTNGNPNIKEMPQEQQSESNGAIYALCLLILPVALICFFLYYKKHKHGQFPFFGISLRRRSNEDSLALHDSAPLPRKPEVAVVAPVPKLYNYRSADTAVANPRTDNNLHSKVVQIVDFENYVKTSLQNGELENQHALFPRGQTKPWDYGALKVNKPKNRYNNLIAYDHTRVKLAKVPGDNYSDYINASYIDGYKTTKAYIATQGPRPSTLDDFWRMIWQENVRHIIMLANIYEQGKKKVEQYWPNINEELVFGNVKVIYISTDIFVDFEYRVFSVICNGEERKIEQLHFTSWPDHGVPLYCQSLVPFLKRILTIPVRNSPMVVHCSAGVGRTGTIILCDISLRMAAREGVVDMLKILEKLRSQRPNMVDNYEQYKLAHLVVLECLMGLETSIACNDEMEENMKRLIENDGVRKEMNYLRDTAWQDQAMTYSSEDDEEILQYPAKNRDQNIVPDIHCRIFISRYPLDDESSSYINAVEVDGFRAPKRFVVTQQPMPNTLGDFWRLVLEKEITNIVSLNEINRNDETCCQFWPTKDLPEIAPVDYIALKYAKSVELECYNIYSLHLIDKKQGQTTPIEVIAMKKWLPKKPLPPGKEHFLTFWEESYAHSRGSKQVLVTCYDGAKASGIYLAMSFSIEKMRLEQKCDVCQAVRNIRHSRKQFISSEDQYHFLLKASLEYINGFQSYANFN